MKRKSIAYLIVLALIASIVLFGGCVEEETTAPMETPAVDVAPASTPEQEAVPTPTPNSTPEQETVLPTPTPEAIVELPTLEPGYEWYQDDEFGYGFGYPENWENGNLALPKGAESGVTFVSESSTKYGFPDASVWVIVYSDSKDIKFWELSSGLIDQVGLEKAKELGVVSKYGNLTLNGRTGLEVIYDPKYLMFTGNFSPLLDMTAPVPTTWTQRTVLFTIDDLDYVIQVTSSNEFYNKYKDTYENVINSFTIE